MYARCTCYYYVTLIKYKSKKSCFNKYKILRILISHYNYKEIYCTTDFTNSHVLYTKSV